MREETPIARRRRRAMLLFGTWDRSGPVWGPVRSNPHTMANIGDHFVSAVIVFGEGELDLIAETWWPAHMKAAALAELRRLYQSAQIVDVPEGDGR
jgi:hypothetical protein